MTENKGAPDNKPVGLDHTAVVTLEDNAAALAKETELKATTVAALAETKAANLASSAHEKEIDLAVKSALRAQQVDSILLAHDKHLAQINGSQKEMVVEQRGIAAVLTRIETKLESTALVAAALGARKLSRRAFRFSISGTLLTLAGVTIGLLGATGNL